MRAITTAQQAVIDSGVQGEHIRVSVKDSGGTFRILNDYPGFNAVKSVQWKESISDPHATCEITLHRELYALSLAPMMQDSALNRAFNPSASYAPLLALTREVKVEVAIVPMDVAPASGDWMEVFRGRIDSLDAAKGYDLSISCRALSGRLAQQFIKTERVYSFAAVSGTSVALRIWAPQTHYVAGEYLIPATRGSDDPGYNKFFVCDTTGDSGTDEPSWSTGTNITDGTTQWDYVGTPTTSGNPVEQIIQNILDDNRLSGDPAVTLYTPVSPGWSINEFLQQREFTLDAIRNLAQQIGWDIRYKWRSGTSQFELTLYEPDRSSPSVVYTFGPDDYNDLDRLGVSISEIRNSWRVIYSDRSDLWPDGSPKRKVIDVADSASITKYGELWAEIQEDEASQIDSSTEATTLANAALSDCSEPTAEMGVSLKQGFPWIELNDYISFTSNGKQFSTTQSLAVTTWSHSYENGKLKTKLDLRGKPTIGAVNHVKKSLHPKIPPKTVAHRMQDFPSQSTAIADLVAIVGGVKAKTVITPDKNSLVEEYEHHVYTSPGSSLDDTTIKALTKSREFEIADLIPGKTYYHRMVSRTKNANKLVRGQPTTEKTIVAGRAQTAHLEGSPAWGRQPLNGGFETRTDPAGMPDHWVHLGGDPPIIYEGSGTDPASGSRHISISCDGSPTELRSAIFQVAPGTYSMTWWVKHDGGTGNLQFIVNGYDDGEANLTTDVIDEANTTNIVTYDTWLKRGYILTTDPDATFLEAQLFVETSGDAVIHIDDIEIVQLLPTPGNQFDDNTTRDTSSGSMSSMMTTSTYQSIPNGPLRVVVETSLFSDDVDTVVGFDVVFTWADGQTETSLEHQYIINQANVHVPICMTFFHAPGGGNREAGTVSIDLRWRVVSGAGVLNQDGTDFTFITMTET